jgi:membrane protein
MNGEQLLVSREPHERRSVLNVPVAIALTGAVIATFADVAIRRLRRRQDDAAQELPHDRSRVPPFDPTAAGVFGNGGPRGAVLRFGERRRWRWLGRTLQVQQRYAELRGDELAASVTLQAFLGLFPLLLVGIAVLGFLQANSTDFASRVIDNLGLHGDAADQLRTSLETAARSRRVTSVIGLLGLLWAGLGFTGALRMALNRAWQVPDRGWRDRPVALVWLLGAGVLLLFGVAATASMRWLPGAARPGAIVVGLVCSFAIFMWTTRVLTNVDVGWRPLVPGALVGAVGLEVLKVVGAFVVPRTVASASALWGSLGLVFAILAWLLFFGKLVVYVGVVDVVLYEARAGTVVSVVELPRHAGATRETTRSGTSRPDAEAAEESRPRPLAKPHPREANPTVEAEESRPRPLAKPQPREDSQPRHLEKPAPREAERPDGSTEDRPLVPAGAGSRGVD